MPSIGRYTYAPKEFPPEFYFEGERGFCTIGKFCSIGSRLRVYLGGDHRMDWISTYPFDIVIDGKGKVDEYSSTKGDVIIGNDVWIGNDVSIMSGSFLGDGCCIGAGSVVRGRFESYSVIIGNPATCHKNRFTIDLAKKLRKLAWWDWELEDVRKVAPMLQSVDVEALFEKAKEMGKWDE